MRIQNNTPFTPFFFESVDIDGDEFFVFVLKGTFQILNGQRLRPVPTQDSLVLADEYYGDPLGSSVRVESDVVPMKQNAEITVEAIAHAPGGQPLPAWAASVAIGKIRKQLRVTGSRRWKYHLLKGWHLTPPEPTLQVPIQYEYAYGGTMTREKESETSGENPVGRGFLVEKWLDPRKEYAASQLEALDDPISSIKKRYEPQGFGPIAKHWLPRRLLCGTADDKWLKTRWPQLPQDFDFDYYNGAPYELINSGFFKGDEEVVLEGLNPEGRVTFRLPSYKLDLLVVDVDQYKIYAAMNLDTVTLDLPSNKAHLVWRATFLKQAKLELLQTKLQLP